MKLRAILALGLLASAARAYEPPQPGDPSALRDWRWLARPLAGTRHVASDPWGKRKLKATDGGFVVLDVTGPGVLDHLWTSRLAKARLTIEVDGQRLWHGGMGKGDSPLGKGDSPLFPKPLLFDAGGMVHLVAPVGFERRLRLLVDKATFPHFASYRIFPKGTRVQAADADPKGAYARGLRGAAALWGKGTVPSRQGGQSPFPFVLPAGSRAVAFAQEGSGEIVALELHVNPALTGTLRQVVVEVTYGKAKAPSLRMPLPDFVGLPHPWPVARWDRHSGTLAAGLRYPWYVRTPRVYFPEATFHVNLPLPFADGIRIELVNRSPHTQFVGHTRAVVAPLAADEAQRAGRLCGTRVLLPVRPAAEPKPLVRLPGPGQVAGLGLFLTGNGRWPRAIRDGVVSLQVDGGAPVTGHGLLPLWLQGIYGGPLVGLPIWSHPRFGEGYAGVMRHFLTDPIPFDREATFAYTPGTEAEGAPTHATAVALWYRFGREPYAAPPLPDRAEPLPHQTFAYGQERLGPDKRPARLAWTTEAEALAPMAQAHRCEVRAADDPDHNYHPSAGRYLHLAAEGPGAYVDCTVPLPRSRTLAVGVYPLWGPGRGAFELDVLSREQAKAPPSFAQGDAYWRGRVLGSPPMQARVFSGDALGRRRDPGCHHAPPLLNPAPGQAGVLRLVCQGKRLSSNSYLLKLDRLRIDIPPPTAPGWRECEAMVVSAASGGLTTRLPRHGRFTWSGWGARLLASPAGGKATLTALAATARAKPSALRLRGCLGPRQGGWQAGLAGARAATKLTPGKDGGEVVEWSIPAEGLRLPGPIVLELECTTPGKRPKGARRTPMARLALDAWTLD